MTLSHSIRNEMCFIRGAVDIPHSRHFRYGDAASDDRVCLALPRLCDPDPVAPAFGGLRLLGLLSILFPLTLILVVLSSSTVQQGEDSIASTCDPTLGEWQLELALDTRVGDSADLASTVRDQGFDFEEGRADEALDLKKEGQRRRWI
ncbi:hypothetical protein Syun_011888 [Stephania yunnanensis]|uniref:Uncharacterized protein n=1 Tax=Stephania yunnanensis TaxID=152371 RepID=A0AAP0JZN1_9MAGN